MKTWKRNAIIAGVLVLVCAGIYLNWLYSGSAPDLTKTLDADKILGESTLVLNPTENGELQSVSQLESGDYFAQMRLSRQTARDEAVNLLQETIAYAEGEDTSSAGVALEKLVSDALTESQIESLVIAKGYMDCVAYISEDGISVAVSQPESGLTESDVGLLADIVLGQTEFALSDIRIFGVE